jgi:RNA polymerase sigma factor (sigma-70 family)
MEEAAFNTGVSEVVIERHARVFSQQQALSLEELQYVRQCLTESTQQYADPADPVEEAGTLVQEVDTIDERSSDAYESMLCDLYYTDILRQAFSCLKERESKILLLRYGFVNGVPWTLAMIAQHFNVTPERIRQIEVNALKKLRHPNNQLSQQITAGSLGNIDARVAATDSSLSSVTLSDAEEIYLKTQEPIVFDYSPSQSLAEARRRYARTRRFDYR